MSADVQPRKRKDKKKKRDSLDSKSEVEIIVGKISLTEDEDVKESHHGVHATKMGVDDVHFHVQGDHATGGHWCAKIFFFSLLAILLGLIGLIIIENRGLSDLDTPLSESRFSEYFDGWVDEHRQAHDDHHGKIPAELEDHDAEPFEEEEDHSEIDEDEEHGEHDEHDDHEEHDEHDDHEEDDEEAAEDTETAEEDEKEQSEEATEEENQEVADEDEDDEDNEDEDEDDAPPAEENSYSRNKREINEEPEDDDDDEGFGDTEEAAEPSDDGDDDDDDNDDDENEESPQPSAEVPALNQEDDPYDEARKSINQSILKEQVDELYEMYEEIASALNRYTTPKDLKSTENSGNVISKDDDDFESLEHVVDNDADEQLHLEQKAKQQSAQSPSATSQEDEEPESSSVTLKVFVGVALAIVARLVLIKNTDTSKQEDPAVSMRRRLTMVTAEEPIPHDDEDPDEIEEECLEEEEDEDEIIEYSEEEVVIEKYVPETYEQLNAMYRPKGNESTKSSGIEELRAKMEDIKPKIEEAQPKIQEIKQVIEEIKPKLEDIAPKKEVPQVSSEVKAPLTTTASSAQTPIKSPDPVNVDVKKEVGTKSGSAEVYEGEYVEELSEEEEEIDEEELGSEEEEISDIDDDDDDLMKRLEAKYGKLPEREYDSEEEEEDIDEDNSWTKIKARQGGGPQSYTEDELIEEELRRANEEMLQNNLQSALRIFESLSLKYPDVPGALYGKAKALDRLSEELKSNQILLESIWAYKRFLALDENIDDSLYQEASKRCIDRMRFRGLSSQAVAIHHSLIKRFPKDPRHRNELAVTHLLSNRFAEAKVVLNETLLQWPNNGFAQVHYGFVLKNLDEDFETAVKFLWKGIKSGDEGTQDGRFYFNLGDALQRLGRNEEARQIYREGAQKKLFPSEFQRSLYNAENLKAQPFWTKKETGYESFFGQLEKNWEKIRDEGLRALNQKGFFVAESESLRDFGDWKQFELFARGFKNNKNCAKAPITCAIIEMFPAARFCKRGQTKFSVMHPNTHVWPHCGPTNCRIRAHLGLKVPPGTKIRVAQEERTWEEGKFLIFDDSFEHEVWHNGTSLRLVLIVDVWHPELTEEQRNLLSPI